VFNASGVDGDIQNGLWAECASTSSFYENRIMHKATQQSPLQSMFKTQFKGINNLRTFEKMFLITTKKNIQRKFYDKGKVGLFAGYPQNHADNVYRIFNLNTKQIIKSRDLIWLNLSYGNWNKFKNNIQCSKDEDLSDSESTDVDAIYLAIPEKASTGKLNGLEAQKYKKP